MFKVGDKVSTNLKAVIFQCDANYDYMAPKGKIGIISVTNYAGRDYNYKVRFDVDGVEFWSSFSNYELTKVD